MLSRFFIHRPIFATVLSIVIVIAGVATMINLPVAQYPEIAPPTVQVTGFYPGASAKVVADTVAQPLEEAVNGLENMLYMSSTSSNDGAYTLTVTFEVGTDLNMAMVQVQNRVAQAVSLLPEEVQRLGLVTDKQSNNILLFVGLYSENDAHDALFMGNYAKLYLENELSRLDGVGNIWVFGSSDYSMRVWLEPDRLDARGLTANDVINAIREQNIQVAAGQLGQMPAPQGQKFQLAINSPGRLVDVEEFENIIVKSLPGGRLLRVKDVATVELGAETYDASSQIRGLPSAAIGIFLQPGSNALATGELVRNRMAELAESFPEGLAYTIPFDTTTFVEESISEVVQTLLIAIGLVFLTILIFLQDWRATLIPAATIPVSLIGTFAVMGFLGVSINMFSLFGLVLAIGVVVDDAIVVVESTVRNMDEHGLNRKEAAIRAMQQVTGPIVATSLVLLVVFVPTAFLGGITGQLYRQFALTIAVATVFSTINALTLSPALSALLLRPTGRHTFGPIRLFNYLFGKGENAYRNVLSVMIRRTVITLLLFGMFTGVALWQYNKIPRGFVPPEDQGWAMMAIQLPDAASLDRTMDVVEEVNRRMEKVPGVMTWVSIPGFSLTDFASSSNAAAVWVVFDPWEERMPQGLTADAIVGSLWGTFGDIQEAMVFAFAPPAIMGLGLAGGFQLQLQERSGNDLQSLQQITMEMMMNANQDPLLENVFSTFRANLPQIEVDVDREKVKSMGLSLSSVYSTLQAAFGSVYVNDFNKFGRTYQVRVQADPRFRGSIDDIRRLKVRTPSGEMAPLGSMATIREVLGPQVITRYNMYPSSTLTGQAVRGHSSGEALAIMEQFTDRMLPSSMGFEWTGMSYQEKTTGNQATYVFILAILLVYLVLCAQYESWTLPLAVILSVPLSLLGTVAGVLIRGMDVNVYTQVGIVLLIALTCKTAILIAEFAKVERDSGKGLVESALEAARLRFRPILMTAATFILGVVPLVIAAGAGAAGRQALGTAVFSGMMAASGLLVIFVPVFFVLIQGFSEWASAKRNGGKEPATATSQA